MCIRDRFIASAAHPIRMSLAPRLVDDIHLPSMVVLTAVNFNTSRLIGPAIGGILIQTFEVSGAILFSIFSFIPVMLFITIIKPRNIEFWQGRKNRLHDRIIYHYDETKWSISRLSP